MVSGLISQLNSSSCIFFFFLALTLRNEVLIVGEHVTPTWFKLILESPHSVSLDVSIKCLINAFTHLADLVLREACAIDWAFSVHSDVRICSKRSLHVSVAI